MSVRRITVNVGVWGLEGKKAPLAAISGGITVAVKAHAGVSGLRNGTN